MTTTLEQENNLRAVAEDQFGFSPCLHCTLFDLTDEDSDEVKCEVFPDGIPDEIFFHDSEKCFPECFKPG